MPITKENTYLAFQRKPFSLISKVVGSKCNLDCTYCYYLDKQVLHGNAQYMDTAMLERYVYQYIESQPGEVINFNWHGGEPTLAGIGFFKKAIEFQKKYRGNKTIENILQTNGTLLNDKWAGFFKENNFLVGLSIDGPEDIHDAYRKYKHQKGSFGKVMKGLEYLQKHKVDYNALPVVSNISTERPIEIYNFLKEIGCNYIQFQPLVERIPVDKQESGLKFVSNAYEGDVSITPWSVNPKKYGDFLINIFDEWVRKDVSCYFVQLFDTTLANHVGAPPGVCLFAKECGHSGVIEATGDMYTCDHYVFPEYHIGNIRDTNMSTLMNNYNQTKFGADKYDTMNKVCKSCKVLKYCHGECPKNRFESEFNKRKGSNYLCEGYYNFFNYAEPYMEFMATQINMNQSPANIMDYLKAGGKILSKQV